MSELRRHIMMQQPQEKWAYEWDADDWNGSSVWADRKQGIQLNCVRAIQDPRGVGVVFAANNETIISGVLPDTITDYVCAEVDFYLAERNTLGWGLTLLNINSLSVNYYGDGIKHGITGTIKNINGSTSNFTSGLLVDDVYFSSTGLKKIKAWSKDFLGQKCFSVKYENGFEMAAENAIIVPPFMSNSISIGRSVSAFSQPITQYIKSIKIGFFNP